MPNSCKLSSPKMEEKAHIDQKPHIEQTMKRIPIFKSNRTTSPISLVFYVGMNPISYRIKESSLQFGNSGYHGTKLVF